MHIDTPIGPLTLVAVDEGLAEIRFGAERSTNTATTSDLLARTATQLREYFAGERTAFDLPLAPTGTPFQRAVWDALCAIPYGETVTYRELAGRVGRLAAWRAVGAANGKNPIPVIVPCHRVVGHDGRLTGFAGGLDAKAALLRLEGARFVDGQRSSRNPARRQRTTTATHPSESTPTAEKTNSTDAPLPTSAT